MGILKIDVAQGVQWVEIPEVNLRVLCGCPADAVKYLIKRGLILRQEVKGVACETGPNAILLSDVLLQNGEFSNLAEFPVLQMLYRQGLLLAGHPNNTGRKPILIGSAEQVESQMRYIYRGNYGLVTPEEIMQTGISEEQANEMMRLKLKFAFDRIRPTSDFLDTRVVSDGETEILDGVTIRRLKSNVFEFSFRGEPVVVNLNLPLGISYECAYPLGFRKFEPEYFAVIHTGEGDGWDADRPSMSSIITFQRKIYLIDAGPYLVNTLSALGIGIDQVDGIFHTHAHDDHFAGLTALMRSYKRVRYFSTRLIRASVEKKLGALLGMEEESFSDFFEVHDLDFDTWNDIEGLEVMPIFSPHPVETNLFAFRTMWGDGYRTYAHFADIVSLRNLKKMLAGHREMTEQDQEIHDRIRETFLVPYDLKKIDVGGGLIHGDVNDFRGDKSKRILLAHRADELTPEEKEIGSSAAFGTVDVLIKGLSDGLRHHVFTYMEENLPGIPLHDLLMLLNHPVLEINPGAIILKEGEMPQEVLLLVSGRIEKIRTSDKMFSNLTGGYLIGIGSMLNNRTSRYTYRASSFVRVLGIPIPIFFEVIKSNGLLGVMSNTADLLAFLESIPLFEGLPVTILRRIIEAATERQFHSGEIINGKDMQCINIIRSGRVECSIGNKVIGALELNSYFGEEGTFIKVPSLFTLRAADETVTVQIPGHILEGVPMLRWKIFESYQKWIHRVIHFEDMSKGINWRNSYSIQVAQLDVHHNQIAEMGNMIMQMIYGGSELQTLRDAMDRMLEYTLYHFTSEEKLMSLYEYPATDSHTKRHNELMRQVLEYRDRVLDGNTPDKAILQNFMEQWFVRHLLDDDRKFGVFLNEKGVY